MLQKTTLFGEILLVNQHVVVHLLATDFTYPESIITRRPLVVKGKAVLDHVSGEDSQCVSAHNEPTLLVHNLLPSLVLSSNKHLNVLQFVFGKPFIIFKDCHNLRPNLGLSAHSLLGIDNLLLNSRRCLIRSKCSGVLINDIFGRTLLPLDTIPVSYLVALLFNDLQRNTLAVIEILGQLPLANDSIHRKLLKRQPS